MTSALQAFMQARASIWNRGNSYRPPSLLCPRQPPGPAQPHWCLAPPSSTWPSAMVCPCFYYKVVHVVGGKGLLLFHSDPGHLCTCGTWLMPNACRLSERMSKPVAYYRRSRESRMGKADMKASEVSEKTQGVQKCSFYLHPSLGHLLSIRPQWVPP